MESQGNRIESVHSTLDKDKGFLKFSHQGKWKGVGRPRIDNHLNPQRTISSQSKKGKTSQCLLVECEENMNLMDRNKEETNPLDMEVGTRLEANCESNMEGIDVESDTASMMGFMKDGTVNETRSGKDSGASLGCRIVVGWDSNVYTLDVKEGIDQSVDLWNDLHCHKLEVGNSPWLILGDFNITLHLSGSIGGTNYITPRMNEFRDCVSDIEVEDLSQARILYI
ncbi:hypothetical protein Pint_12207 [Pistacia integerrima]|uniref:Uncharacterized protein n=1 Tax=Pistacia integerrima TaxID=434235 RepID=A0ACC0XJG6_9ROSI|nr:hypothetical protein Pint_12207 [Pistacia integerrima]